MLHLSLSPSRQLHLNEIEGESLWPEAKQQKTLLKAFAAGPGDFLLELASDDTASSRPAEFSWLASFGRTLLGELCHRQDASVPAELSPPPGWLEKQHGATPPFAGKKPKAAPAAKAGIVKKKPGRPKKSEVAPAAKAGLFCCSNDLSSTTG